MNSASGACSLLNPESGCANVAIVTTTHITVPSDLRPRLEDARLDNLALMRALDRAFPAGPPVTATTLRAFGEFEADCGEALWALDQPAGSLDVRAMVRDTLASLERLPDARARIRAELTPRERTTLRETESAIRAGLDPAEAYSQVPGRDITAPSRKVAPSRATGPRVGRNDPCPCGSGKKYKKCCASRTPDEPPARPPQFRFEPGSYGGPGGFFPSIVCTKDAVDGSGVHFVLVKSNRVWEESDDAAEEATRDLDGAFAGGASASERVALHLRAAGYLVVDDPRIVSDRHEPRRRG